MLVRNWAPQLEILAHKSTGVFLSHCGWNSVLESLSQGIPIIGWPLAEENGVCVELCNGALGTIGCDELKKVIDLVMERGDEGDLMKRKAIAYK